jgi:5-methylthioadenosine/S-adenosylhomocysteine deaminase
MKRCAVMVMVIFCCNATPQERVDLIVYGGTLITMNATRAVIPNGFVAIKDSVIVAVGAGSPPYHAKESIDATGYIVVPGLINGHTHAAMTLFRGIADDSALHEWLERYVFPLEKQYITPELVYWGTKLACLEMLRGGITTFADMYFFEDEVAKAASEIGMRVVAGQTVMDAPTPDSATAQQGFERTRALIENWRGNSLVTPAIAPHAPYSASAQTLKQAADISATYNVPFLIHLSETASETGKGAAYLHSLGVLTPRVIAAHVVHPTAQDMTLLQQEGVGVIHCPVSNMKLSSGISPVTRMLRRGIAVGIGTDGAASNNALDLIADIKVAALLQKVLGHQTDLNALEAFELATISGARAIHQQDQLGSIEVSKYADLVIMNIQAIHQIPLYNLMSQLVYATKASDVQTVIVAGKVLMRNRLFSPHINQQEIRKKVQEFQRIIMHTKSSL